MAFGTAALADGYTAEFETIAAEEWYRILPRFADANIYQTWAYDSVRCGEKNLSHFVLRYAGEIVAAAQARILRIPLVGLGAAYIRWGPLWQLRERNLEPAIFRNAIRELRNEYVGRRGLILRLLPLVFEDNAKGCRDILLDEGYKPAPNEKPQRTLVLGIHGPLEQLRKNFQQKWRNCLNKAERNNLEIIEGAEDHLYLEFMNIYKQLLQRKKFQKPNDINEFRAIQRALPNEYKMRVFLCRSMGIISSGAICSAIGDTGVYLFGATNEQGMKDKGSYVAQWKAIQWMREQGCQYYNLNGINPSNNPGSYHFKAGLAGKDGKDLRYLGRFDSSAGVINRALTHWADRALPIVKKIVSTGGS